MPPTPTRGSGFRWNYEEAGGGQDRTRWGHGARGKTEHWVAVFVLPGGWVAIGVLCTGPNVMCFETKVSVLDHKSCVPGTRSHEFRAISHAFRDQKSVVPDQARSHVVGEDVVAPDQKQGHFTICVCCQGLSVFPIGRHTARAFRGLCSSPGLSVPCKDTSRVVQ